MAVLIAVLVALVSAESVAGRKLGIAAPGGSQESGVLSKKQSRLTSHVYHLGSCNESTSYTRIYNWSQSHGPKGELSINASVGILKEMSSVSKALLTIIKCSEFGTGCERVLALRAGREACALWATPNMFWSIIRERLYEAEPPHRLTGCPTPAGRYELVNGGFDYARFAQLSPYPVTNVDWTFILEVWDQDHQYHMCFCTAGKILRFIPRE